jgi:RNA polymerase sigma-70 factor (ECF subfamily)
MKASETLPGPIETLIARVQAGDRDSFRSIVRHFERAAYVVALSLVRDPGLAEDIVQESFLKVYSELSPLREPSRFSAWLSQIVRRRALNARRHQKVLAALAQHAAELKKELPPERIRELLEALDQIDEDHRTALLAFYVEGLSYLEIAALLDVPASTVRGRLYKAKIALRRLMEDRT